MQPARPKKMRSIGLFKVSIPPRGAKLYFLTTMPAGLIQSLRPDRDQPSVAAAPAYVLIVDDIEDLDFGLCASAH